mmetsp:Transcript_28437/g.82252  ORF Transcript_28437/g.82252 Transcript_28437/m.82252 type:complete len:203 (-) Transcript_28437:253-861(-)
MGAGDEVEVVPLVEHGHDVPTEQIPGPARRQAPPVDLLRVGPEQIAHGPVVGHLLLPIDDADLIEGVDARTQSAVDGEDLVLNDGRKAEIVKDLRAVPPNIDAAVLAQALVVEAVDLGDLPTLVVAADEGDAIGVADLEGQKEEEGLHGVVAPIDEVAKEQVILVGAFASDLEQLDEVVELSVNVAAYRYRRIDPLDVALVH